MCDRAELRVSSKTVSCVVWVGGALVKVEVRVGMCLSFLGVGGGLT